MSALPSRPSLDRRQIERAMERGRARMGALADTMTAEHMAELIDDLRDEADILAEAIASSASETDLWYDTSKELV